MTIFTPKPHNKSCFSPQTPIHRTNSHNPFIKTPFQRFHFTPSKLIHRHRILVSCNNTQQQDTKESHNKVSKAKSNALTDLDNDVEQQQVEGFSVNWPPWK